METKKAKCIDFRDYGNDFYSVLSVAGEYGKVVIVKDGKQRYALYDLTKERVFDLTDGEKIDVAANRVINKYLPAFKELAK